jgi:hypothetical protein
MKKNALNTQAEAVEAKVVQKENALVFVANEANLRPNGEVLLLSGKEFFLNLETVKQVSISEVASMEAEIYAIFGENFLLKTEADRKKYNGIRKSHKDLFVAFDKNLQKIKGEMKEIPNIIQAAQNMAKLYFNNAFKDEGATTEIDEQKKLIQKWADCNAGKTGLPNEKYSLENLLEQTKLTSPSLHSNDQELEFFKIHKDLYIKAIAERLAQIAAKEKQDREEAERQAQESARLAEERRKLDLERAEQQRIAAEQAREAARIAEKEREVEAARQAVVEAANNQQAVNPSLELAGAPANEAELKTQIMNAANHVLVDYGLRDPEAAKALIRTLSPLFKRLYGRGV